MNQFLEDIWNGIAGRIQDVSFLEFKTKLAEKTKDYSFTEWKRELTILIRKLDRFDHKTIIALDEFPDMIEKIKQHAHDDNEFLKITDALLSWLREIRTESSEQSKCRFVFTGSINLKNTLDALGFAKRINDLETVKIPPMGLSESQKMIAILAESYQIKFSQTAIDYISLKIEGGPPIFGQWIFTAIRESNLTEVEEKDVQNCYNAFVRSGNLDLTYFYKRLSLYFQDSDHEIAQGILKLLCVESLLEDDVYDYHFMNRCEIKQFSEIVNRLCFEGYILRDANLGAKLRFVSLLLKDWWKNKLGIR